MPPKFCYLFIFLVLLSSNVSASYIRPKWYHAHQILDYVDEEVYISTNKVDVLLSSEILIDDKIFNISDFISFTYSPLFDYNFEKLNAVDYYIGARTSETVGNVYSSNIDLNYSVDKNITISRYEFNISISELEPWDEIIFLSNFTLGNKVREIRDAEYSLLYISQHDARHQRIIFRFPYNFEIIRYPDNGDWSYGLNSQNFQISENYANKPLYFVFRDINETKSIETQNQITNLIVGAILGAILGGLMSLGISLYLRRCDYINKIEKLKLRIKAHLHRKSRGIQKASEIISELESYTNNDLDSLDILFDVMMDSSINSFANSLTIDIINKIDELTLLYQINANEKIKLNEPSKKILLQINSIISEMSFNVIEYTESTAVMKKLLEFMSKFSEILIYYDYQDILKSLVDNYYQIGSEISKRKELRKKWKKLFNTAQSELKFKLKKANLGMRFKQKLIRPIS